MKSLALSAALCLALGSAEAHAWDGSVTGRVALIQMAADGSVTIQLVGSPQLCTAGTAPISAFVRSGYESVTDNGLKAMVSILTAAMLSGKTVTLYVNNNGTPAASAYGCNVGGLQLNP